MLGVSLVALAHPSPSLIVVNTGFANLIVEGVRIELGGQYLIVFVNTFLMYCNIVVLSVIKWTC